MAQLNYSYETPSGLAGGKVDIGFDTVVSRKNTSDDGDVKFGMGVVKGTVAGKDVKKVVSGSQAGDFEGIVLQEQNVEQNLQGQVILKKGAELSVMTQGNVWGRVATEVETAPTYKATAYLVVDGDDAGSFTNQSSSYSVYVKCLSTDTGAKKVVADSTANPTSDEIKLASVTPTLSTYTPAVNDYVVSKQLHGAGVDVGAKFGNEADTKNGIAVIEL